MWLVGLVGSCYALFGGLRTVAVSDTLNGIGLLASLTEFFAAAMIGAILSSFNSALNSSCTLFSLGLYQGVINRNASEQQVVRSGKVFGWIVALAAMAIAPLLANTTSIFAYLVIYVVFADFSVLPIADTLRL